jgi:rubrerythrin
MANKNSGKAGTALRCQKCGFRIRGKNHENGPHCQSGKDRRAKVGD